MTVWVIWGMTSQLSYGYERRRRAGLRESLHSLGFLDVLRNLHTRLPRLNAPRGRRHASATLTSTTLLESPAGHEPIIQADDLNVMIFILVTVVHAR